MLSAVTVNFSRYFQPCSEQCSPNALRVARRVKHFSSSSRCSTACVSTQNLIARKRRSLTTFRQRKSNSNSQGEMKCVSTSATATSLPSVEEVPPSRSFTFPLKRGGMVSFFVEEHRDDEEFRIWVNVTTKTLQEPVTLNWGVYREVLDELSPLDEIPEGSTERDDTVCTPLSLTVAETRAHGTTEIVIPEYLSPCGVAFNITDCSGILASDAWDPDKPLTFPIGFGTGHPSPLGVKQKAYLAPVDECLLLSMATGDGKVR
ncbi:hypothetical protein CYMTET_35931 [Cymbomonas tetramitiformis]|uniref:Uncharacterized protein n=1 Tax=Cymbomonas tetramitiformis TaxID=36881 RepID=A0AAE0KNK1_9CHLO|nr:hypothetical protein CYMTET_35931 [Cymbomonas tetramitiformis]